MTKVKHIEISQSVALAVPPLPAQVRHYDDFADKYHVHTRLSESDEWRLYFNGGRGLLDFSSLNGDLKHLLKGWCVFMLCNGAPSVVGTRLRTVLRITPERLSSLVASTPTNVKRWWSVGLSTNLDAPQAEAVKSLLRYLCNISAGEWSPLWLDLISLLPWPKYDKYAAVRSGAVFLSVNEESTIVRFIDDCSLKASKPTPSLSDDTLAAAAMLVCNYMFGMRPKQIAMLKIKDVRIWKDGVDGVPAVHLSFKIIKQRSGRSFTVIRRVKREWTSLFVELLRRMQNEKWHASDFIFRCSPGDVSTIICDSAQALLNRRRTPTEFRHTAAQRLVDAGANEEELAAFMGQTDLNSGLVYFGASASQAEKVNRALGISPIYQQIVKVAHDRFISEEELAALKGDKQIAGVPHGIPISGIGGCTVGQPKCPYSPVLSCYGCPKFMPIAQVDIHQRVLRDMRNVVRFFYESSRGNAASPAYLQLQRNIATVQSVIEELQEGSQP